MNPEALIQLDQLRASPIGKVLGIDPNPNRVAYECENCIGTCCLGPIMDVRPDEMGVLLDGDTVLLRHGHKVQDLIEPESAQNDPLIRASDLDVMDPTKETTVRVLGPCGNQTPTGLCSKYKSPEYPEPCSGLRMGGYECKMRFVARDSEAAEEVKRRIAAAQESLQEIRDRLHK